MARAAQAEPSGPQAPDSRDAMLRLVEDIFYITADPQTRAMIRFIRDMTDFGAELGERAVQRAQERTARRCC
jgi:hypothetical protein